jgi:HlyD family secretion protein
MRLQRRYVWYAAGLLATVWVAVRMLRPETIPADVVPAVVGPLIQTVGDEGQTRVRHRHVITAPLPGRLQRITLQVGDTVRAGTVVARLAPLPLDARTRQQAEAALQAARDLERMSAAAVDEARTALEQAREDRTRGAALAAGGGLAPADLQRLELIERARARGVEAAEAQAQATAHDAERAQLALLAAGRASGTATLELICPIGGRVLTLPEQSERTVSAGQTLLEVGDPADLELVVDLLSTDAVKVQPGQRLLMDGWGGGTTLEGRVRRVEPAGFTKISALGVEEQRVNVVGDFDSIPPGLGDRYRLDVRVVLWAGDSVLTVPASALFRRGEAWALFTVEEGRARERTVTVGHESATDSEILAGVSPGTLVIRHPTDRIRDGSRVTPVAPGS